jgi:transposase
MAKRARVVIGGVDTHGRTHHAAVVDQHGRLLADAEFAAHTDGYRQLLGWLGRHGHSARSAWRAPAPTAPG